MQDSDVFILATATHARHGDAAVAFVDYQIDMSKGVGFDQWMAVRALLVVWIVAAAAALATVQPTFPLALSPKKASA